MRPIGFGFKKIHAERKKTIQGELKVNSNLEVEDIKKEKVDIAGEVLKFSFGYSIQYTPEIGEVIFKGEVIIIPDNPEDIKQVMKDWKKKKLTEKIKIPLFNYIMSKCNLKALQLEEELALPSHIPLPRLSRQQGPQQGQPGQANYTG